MYASVHKLAPERNFFLLYSNLVISPITPAAHHIGPCLSIAPAQNVNVAIFPRNSHESKLSSTQTVTIFFVAFQLCSNCVTIFLALFGSTAAALRSTYRDWASEMDWADTTFSGTIWVAFCSSQTVTSFLLPCELRLSSNCVTIFLALFSSTAAAPRSTRTGRTPPSPTRASQCQTPAASQTPTTAAKASSQ